MPPSRKCLHIGVLQSWIPSLTEVLAPVAPNPVTTGAKAQRIADALIEGRPPAFDPELLRAWLNAADWLVESGHLEAAKAALAVLTREQPGLEWAANLAELLRLAPAPERGVEELEDDLGKDVQVVARPGSDAALLLFCGAKHRLGMPVPLIHRWLARLGVSLVYLRDFHGLCYLKGVASLGRDRPETITALRGLLDGIGVRRLVCLGCSGGGFGALLYALELGGDAISMGSPTSMEPEFLKHMNHSAAATELKAAFPYEDLDLRRRLEAAGRPPRALIVYAERNWNERIQAEHAAGLQRAELHPVTGYKGHATAAELIRRGEFEPMLASFISGAAVHDQ